MKQVELSCGYTAEIDENIFDDIELFEKIVRLDRKDMTVLPELLTAVFGEEGRKRLYECLREDGKVKLTSATEVFFELVEKLEVKK